MGQNLSTLTMPRKRTPTTKKSAPPIVRFFQALWAVVKGFFIGLYQIIKTILGGLLTLLEKILRFIVDFVIAIAKIIQAVGVAFFAVAASVFLVVLAGYFFSKAIDLPASKNFQAFREEVWEILVEAAEPDFTAWRESAQAWIDYRKDLRTLYESEISQEEKVEGLKKLKEEFYLKIDLGDPSSLEARIWRGE